MWISQGCYFFCLWSQNPPWNHCKIPTATGGSWNKALYKLKDLTWKWAPKRHSKEGFKPFYSFFFPSPHSFSCRRQGWHRYRCEMCCFCEFGWWVVFSTALVRSALLGVSQKLVGMCWRMFNLPCRDTNSRYFWFPNSLYGFYVSAGSTIINPRLPEPNLSGVHMYHE